MNARASIPARPSQSSADGLKRIERHWNGRVDHGLARVRYCRMFDFETLGPSVNPFLLMDYFGPGVIPPGAGARGFPEHPHKGFETVTIAYQGAVSHRDSTGGEGTVGPGDVQWMTAGRGVQHEEFLAPANAELGGPLQMVQLWINLPARFKLAPARYQPLDAAAIPVVAVADGVEGRPIAGRLAGICGPAETFTATNLFDLRFEAGSEARIDLTEGHVAILSVLEGEIALNGDVVLPETGNAQLSRDGASVVLKGVTDSRVLLMSAEPIDEPVVSHGPFVMNSRDEIIAAIEDYRSGRFGRLG